MNELSMINFLSTNFLLELSILYLYLRSTHIVFIKKNPGSLITYIFKKNQSPKSFRHLKFNLQITIRDE